MEAVWEHETERYSVGRQGFSIWYTADWCAVRGQTDLGGSSRTAMIFSKRELPIMRRLLSEVREVPMNRHASEIEHFG